ncbi:UNVERIFIED_CONTAM: Flap-structured DNA-binding and RNA-binding protein, partial [Siphonaria sp. JEL0065]
MDAKRPQSDLLPAQSTPEAQGRVCALLVALISAPRSPWHHFAHQSLFTAINQWFSDLSYYESTLEQMAASKLDDSFREELKAIEQWFAVLSDPERTSALYALLKHTTPVQVRFFITVLQQMAAKDAASALPLGAVQPIGVGGVKHSSTPAPVKTTEIDLLSIATGNSLRLSMDHPKTPIDAAIAQANWSTPNSTHHGAVSPLLASNPGQAPNYAVPVQAQGSPLIQPRTFSAHPGEGWGHVNLAGVGRSKSGAGGANTIPGSDYSDYEDYGNAGNGVNGVYREKGKIPEVVDLTLLNAGFRTDVPAWLRSLRLHKYAGVFEGCTWRDMVKMTDAEMEARGVSALGARNKLSKVFEL